MAFAPWAGQFAFGYPPSDGAMWMYSGGDGLGWQGSETGSMGTPWLAEVEKTPSPAYHPGQLLAQQAAGLQETPPNMLALPTMGSAKHATGFCKPCAFVFSGGCFNGVACTFCHLCDPGEKGRRKKVRVGFRRAARDHLQQNNPQEGQQEQKAVSECSTTDTSERLALSLAGSAMIPAHASESVGSADDFQAISSAASTCAGSTPPSSPPRVSTAEADGLMGDDGVAQQEPVMCSLPFVDPMPIGESIPFVEPMRVVEPMFVRLGGLDGAVIPSEGSQAHDAGSCKPCAFHFKGGCATGSACQFCHRCGPGERKRRKREMQAVQREMQARSWQEQPGELFPRPSIQ